MEPHEYRRTRIALASLLIGGAVWWQMTQGAGLGAVLLVSATISLWATALLPELLTALLFFLAATLLQVAPAAVVFSGFASGAFWLVLSGMVIGVAVQNASLGERLAYWVRARIGRSYTALIAALVAAGFLLGFVFPSSLGRIALLVPVAVIIAEHCGFAAGSNGRRGVVFAAAFGTHLPTFAVLPANVPNLVLAGSAERLGVHMLYGDYLLLHLPVLGIMKALLLIALVVRLFPDRMQDRKSPAPEHPAVCPSDRRLLMVLAFALVMWVTDSLHHVAPASVALAAAVLLMLPGWGPLAVADLKGRIDLTSLLFVAAVLGLGAVVAETGLGALLAEGIGRLLPIEPATPALNFASLVMLAFVTGLVTTLAGVPAVLTPLTTQFSAAAGVAPEAVMMTQVLGFSTVLLPYQSPPLMLAVALAGERLAPAARLAVVLAVLTLLVLLPVNYWWWQVLGWW